MKNKVSQIHAAKILAVAMRLSLSALIALGASACERPGAPPSPADPAKPKMQAGRNIAELQRAVFNYVRPAGKSTFSLQPEPETSQGGRLQV